MGMELSEWISEELRKGAKWENTFSESFKEILTCLPRTAGV